MFKIKTVITYRRAANVSQRKLNAAVRAELDDLGVFWHTQYLPLHFEPSAYSRYGPVFTKRGAKYNRRKGHSRPMVQSGELRRQALSRADVKASPKSLRVTMRGLPRAVNLWNGKRKGPNFRAELTAIAPDEANRFARRLDAGLPTRLLSLTATRTKHIE